MRRSCRCRRRRARSWRSARCRRRESSSGQLSNGAKVLFKPTDFKADEILVLRRAAPGGESLVADADVVNADLSSVVMSRSGVGSFNAIALGKKLAGKKVNVAAGIDGTVKDFAAPPRYRMSRRCSSSRGCA